MKNTSFKICNENVHPKEKTTLALPLPEQYSCSPMYMPIKVINGKYKGPCLLVFAILNGDEFDGLEIVNRLFDDISTDDLQGTLIAIPVFNIYGLIHFPKLTPSGTKIADFFPGDKHGNFSERFAHVFTQEILTKVNYCIELQTGSLNHEILPHVYCDFENQEVKKLAKAFQTPVITELNIRSSSLRMTIENLNIPLIVYEAGEAMRFNTQCIQIGLQGVKNVMCKLEMLAGVIDDTVPPLFSKNDDWLISPSSGILHIDVALGELVKKGAKIGHLSDPFKNDATTVIKSILDGIVVGINRTPLIQEGVSIFKITSFIDNKRAESTIDKWEYKQPNECN